MSELYDLATELEPQLREYAELDNTESGEACLYLCSLVRYTGYVNEAFYKALVSEMKKQLKDYKKHCHFEEKEVTKTYTVKELVYDY